MHPTITPERTSPRDPRDGPVVWAVLTASAAMLLWMARPLWTGRVPFTGDLLHFHYPLRDFYARALAAGQSFDWMPSLYGGFHAAGEGQMGAYHPLHWLLYRFVPLDTAFAIEIVAAYPFLFAGMWLLLRRWTGAGAAAFGAMAFTFCGFTLSHGVHVNMVSIVAHMPWLLWAAHRTFAAAGWQGRARGAAIIGALTGSQLLLGHPQAVWFSLLIEAAYVLLLMSESSKAARRRGAPAVAGAKLLGLAIGAVQVLATLHAVDDRAALDPSFATTFALPPVYFLQMLEPYLMWSRVLRWSELAGDEFAAYGGAVALVLAVWWLASAPGRRAGSLSAAETRLGLAALAFGLLGLWLAIGAEGGLYLLQTYVPLLDQFRAPARYILFTQLSLAVLAALALARLARPSSPDDPSSGRGLWAAWCVAAASAFGAVWWIRRTGLPAAEAGQGVLVVAFGPMLFATLGPMLFVAAAHLLTLAARGARWALVGLVLLAAADQALYGLGGVLAWQDYIARADVPDLFEAETSGLVPRGPARIARGGNPNIWVLDGYRAIEGYAAIEPRRILDYRSPQALSVAGVEYVHVDLQRVAELPGAEPLTDSWYRIEAPVARARLVTESRVSEQPSVDLLALDVEHAALTTRALSLSGGPAGTAEIVRDEPGDIQVMTAGAGRQLLVVSEGFDAGWTAVVDGQPTPVERVNGDFIGCVVPTGEHDVAFRFRPAYRVPGLIISLLGALAALLLATGSRLPKRERASPGADLTTSGANRAL